MANLSTASLLVFNLAAEEAKALNSVYIDVDHLMLGLLKAEDLLAAIQPRIEAALGHAFRTAARATDKEQTDEPLPKNTTGFYADSKSSMGEEE